MKMGTSWIATGATLQINGSQLDSNGYPTSLPSGTTNINTTIFVPTQAARPGNYVLSWDGNGTILCSCSDTLVSGSKTSTTGSGSYTFSTTGNQFTVGIVAPLGTPPISNIRLLHVNDVASYNAAIAAGKTWGGFSQNFLNKLKSNGYGVERNIIASINFSNVTTWDTRKPINYAYYAGGEYRSSMYTSTTSPSSQVYVGSLGSGNPVDKQTAQIQWAATISCGVSSCPASAGVTSGYPGNPTQIIWTAHGRSVGDIVAWTPKVAVTSGGTCTPPTGFVNATPGAQTVYYVQAVVDANTITLAATSGGSVITATGAGTGTCTLSPVISFQMNSGASPIFVGDERGDFPMQVGFNSEPAVNGNTTLVYDAGLNLWLKFGTPGTSNTRGYLDNGWPPELYVELGVETGMHPYFNPPYLSMDTATSATPLAHGTNWASSMASYVQSNGPSWMIPRFEGINESPWNSLFYGAGYINNRGTYVYGWSSLNVYGKMVSTMGQDVNLAYGNPTNDGTKYQILMGIQTHSTTPSSNMTSANNDKLNTPSFVTAGGSAAKNWITHIAIDQYITPCAFRTNQEWELAWDYVKNGTTADLNTYVDTLDGTCAATNFNLTWMNTLYQQWAVFAAGFTNNGGQKIKVTGYEGGYTVEGSGTNPAFNVVTSTVSGIASAANPCVLTMANSSVGGVTQTGNPAVAGMQVVMSGIGGALGTLLNGNTYTIQSGVSGNSVPINVDCTAQTFTSNGIATYQLDGTTTGSSQFVLNTFRMASKNLATDLASYTFGGVSGSQANYSNFVAAGVGAGTVAEFPSQFTLAGSSAAPPFTGVPGSGPSVWGMCDPDVYVTPTCSTAQSGIAVFNH